MERKMRIDHIAAIAAVPRLKSTEQLRMALKACLYWEERREAAAEYWRIHERRVAKRNERCMRSPIAKDRYYSPNNLHILRLRINKELAARGVGSGTAFVALLQQGNG